MPLPHALFHAVHAAPDPRVVGGAVVLRVATRGAEPLRAFLRTEPDNEERLTHLTNDGERGDWRHDTVTLERAPHDPGTRYAFRFVFATHQRWLAQDGLHGAMPAVDVHSRHLHDYRSAAWTWDQVFDQIFPDRFRDGDRDTNVRSGQYRYGGQSVVARAWDELPTPGMGAREFFGGDLDGVCEALPYLEDLGASTLYLNPIFTSPSSHTYDTVDFDHVDPHLGGDDAFARLLEALRERGMRVVLDAVVNHTSEQHPWFGKRAAASQDAAAADATTPGAYASPASATRDHYVFVDQDDPESYHGWAGVRTLPVPDFASPGVRGRYETLMAEGDVFAFARVLGEEAVVTVLHRGREPRAVTLPVWATGVRGPWTDALRGAVHDAGDALTLTLPPRSGTVLVAGALAAPAAHAAPAAAHAAHTESPS